MCLTLAMLAYSMHEKQWESPAINRQNITNEVILYTIATLFLLCRGNLAQVQVYDLVGPVMLTLIGLFILVNCLAMLYSALCAITLCLKRVYGTYLKNKMLKQKQSLVEDINRLTIKIDNDEIFSPMTTRKYNCSLKSL